VDDIKRRSLLKLGTNLMGVCFAGALGVPAVGYLIDPRNRPAAKGEFRGVTRFSELVENVPASVAIRDTRHDAWTLHPNDVLGRVWLIYRGERDDAGVPRIEAYTAICPHLGGSINFDKAKQQFVCPLHGATFDAACKRVSAGELGRENPAPRDMDSLEIEVLPDPATPGDYLIRVKYENFIQGREEKVKKE
jgi:menaquinol-cytochrome c reductase iron-sulfur subunit